MQELIKISDTEFELARTALYFYFGYIQTLNENQITKEDKDKLSNQINVLQKKMFDLILRVPTQEKIEEYL